MILLLFAFPLNAEFLHGNLICGSQLLDGSPYLEKIEMSVFNEWKSIQIDSWQWFERAGDELKEPPLSLPARPQNQVIAAHPEIIGSEIFYRFSNNVEMLFQTIGSHEFGLTVLVADEELPGSLLCIFKREFGIRTYCGKLKSPIPSSSAVGMLDGPPGPPPLPPLCVLGLGRFHHCLVTVLIPNSRLKR